MTGVKLESGISWKSLGAGLDGSIPVRRWAASVTSVVPPVDSSSSPAS